MSSQSFARRYSRSVVFTAAALVVASGVGFSQGTSNQDSAGQNQERTNRLPNFYARVVSDDQRKAIYEIQDKYAPTIDELQKQLDEAIAARDKEIEGVLTPEQVARVKEYQQEAEARREARRGRGRRGRSNGGDAGSNGGGGR